MEFILYPVAIIGGLGVIYGLILAFASIKFKIEVDPKIEQVLEVTPGANCGACGFPGCSAYAEAIVKEGAEINKCAPGGQTMVDKVAEIMGVKAGAQKRKVAVILCGAGGTDRTNTTFEYNGVNHCKIMNTVGVGTNACSYGCLGGNSCVDVCLFGAIALDEFGNKTVDNDKCTGCGTCVKECPRELIVLADIDKEVHVYCSNKDKGVVAKKNCGAVACIGCKLCEKKCPVGAITVEDNLAKIDYDKCISCGLCASACPTGVLVDNKEKRGKAKITDDCIGCTLCTRVCPTEAISGSLKEKHVVDPEKCIGCEACVAKCPKKAIEIEYTD